MAAAACTNASAAASSGSLMLVPVLSTASTVVERLARLPTVAMTVPPIGPPAGDDATDEPPPSSFDVETVVLPTAVGAAMIAGVQVAEGAMDDEKDLDAEVRRPPNARVQTFLALLQALTSL